eukprot:gene877-1353_t
MWRRSASVIVACPIEAFETPSWCAKGKEQQADYRVCLMKRSEGASFMGSTSVFPGGALDDEDIAFAAGVLHDPATASKVCAVRESFEEAGAVFVKPYPTEYPVAWRDRAKTDATAFFEMVDALGVLPDVDAMHFWCSFTTPDAVAVRMERGGFMTDFFATTVTRPQAHQFTSDQTETSDLVWLTPDEALRAHASRAINLPPPQWVVFDELSKNVCNLSDLASYAASPQRSLIRDHDIKPYVLLPHPDTADDILVQARIPCSRSSARQRLRTANRKSDAALYLT